ncbi:MAG: hypothetical protein WA776_00670 [Xanthobacteraceae bacterium]
MAAEKEYSDDANGGIDRSAGPKAKGSEIIHYVVLFVQPFTAFLARAFRNVQLSQQFRIVL